MQALQSGHAPDARGAPGPHAAAVPQREVLHARRSRAERSKAQFGQALDVLQVNPAQIIVIGQAAEVQEVPLVEFVAREAAVVAVAEVQVAQRRHVAKVVHPVRAQVEPAQSERFDAAEAPQEGQPAAVHRRAVVEVHVQPPEPVAGHSAAQHGRHRGLQGVQGR